MIESLTDPGAENGPSWRPDDCTKSTKPLADPRWGEEPRVLGALPGKPEIGYEATGQSELGVSLRR